MAPAADRTELTRLLVRIRELVGKKPDKAVTILTAWIRSTPVRANKSTRKKQAA